MRALLVLVLWVAASCGGGVAPCNVDDDCRADAVCLEGVCALRAPPLAPVAPTPCEGDTHDGGDGACVARDVCSDGFSLLFRDADGDGVGAGARVECAALPAPLGLADVDGDCNDDDPAGFTLTEFFADADNDGFTRRVTVCGDGAPPPGAPLVARPAPVLAAHPSALPLMLADGDGDAVQVRTFGGLFDNDVAVTGLRCPALPGPIAGAAAHARVRLDASCCNVPAVVLVVTARFTAEDGSIGELRTTSTPSMAVGDTVDIVFGGGAGDTFGLDAEALCDATLDLVFVGVTRAADGTAIADNANVTVDTAWLELFAAEDCDDGDADVFSPATLFGDDDGDGQGGGAGTPACIGSELPSAGSLAALDCDDTDAEVRLGQSLFFPTASAGDTFDYDCNGVLEPASVTTSTLCAVDGKGGCSQSATAAEPAPCGALVDAQECDGSCTLVSAPQAQRCR